MTISERIFELMEEQGLSQKEFAEITGISQNTINDWKKQKTIPSTDNLRTICKTLNITLSDLLSSTEPITGIENFIYIEKNTKEYYLADRYHHTETALGNRLIKYMQGLTTIQNNKNEN